jgi:hypothetical protein
MARKSEQVRHSDKEQRCNCDVSAHRSPQKSQPPLALAYHRRDAGFKERVTSKCGCLRERIKLRCNVSPLVQAGVINRSGPRPE